MKKLMLSFLILSLVSVVSITGLEASAQDGCITLALTAQENVVKVPVPAALRLRARY